MSCPSETRLQAFVDGELSGEDIAGLSEHLDACHDCRTLVALAMPVPLDEASTADRIGRYVLRRVLGQGGMGVVYEAVDPELQRVVALKVLRSAGEEQRRLLKEAQAMALLSHPNVVTVHDVGRFEGRVFIVMALVDGVSLRHFIAQERRSLDTLLDTFEQAGIGLCAAHAAGLVHRDFKPENVFVAKDGRVLVGDFGLAVGASASASEVAGSLAYMAPEQRSAARIDARADQYSFCVALEEAVSGQSVIPRWLTRLVARGKSASPDERFSSMDALLGALRSGRRRLRRNRGLALVALLATGLVAGGLFRAHGRNTPERALCRGTLGEMAAIWNEGVAARLEGAFHGTKSPLSDSVWKKTRAALDGYTSEWLAACERTCEAPEASGGSGGIFAVKTSCLRERLEMVRAVTTSLERVDAPMLEQVPSMLQLLPRVDACEDARAVAQLAPPPSADKASAVEASRRKIDAAAATIAGGRYKEGLTLAETAWQEASATGYLPVLADAYFWVGTAHGRLGETPEAERAFEQAASSASAGHAPATAIRAWIGLMHFVGYEGKRYHDGARYADYAKAALESLPGAFELEAERLTWSRAMLLDRKRFDEALAVSRQELALVELRFGAAHRLTAAALDGLAGVLAGQCKPRSAEEPQERACGILEKEVGALHPQLALCLGNLAGLQAQLGEHERALTLKRRALSMFEVLPGHPNHVSMGRRNLVRSLLELGRLDEASRELERAAALSPRESDAISVLGLRGDLQRRQGKIAEAVLAHELAVARTRGHEPARRIEPLVALAQSHAEAERWNEAISSAEQALTFARAVHGESSCRTAEPERLWAEALLGAGKPSEALPHAERALVAWSSAEPDPLVRARAELAVARALPSSERERAVRLATSARAVAERDGRDKGLLARVDLWLSGNR